MPGKSGRDRQRALARAKLERQMARRAAAARKRRQMQAGIGAIVAVVVLVAGGWFLISKFGGTTVNNASANASASASASASPPPGSCVYSKDAGQPVKGARNVGVPTTTNVPHTGTQTVTITTNQGVVEFTMDTAKAPCTSHSFTFLADKKYYDNTPCHRILTSGSYMLQCGDPTGTGQSGPGYQFGTENLPTGKTPPYPAGTVAMANASDPNTNGSQFFLVYKDSNFDGPNYSVFGKITKGLDVLTKIAAGGVTGSDQSTPKTKVTITSVKVTPPPAG
ncbi:peptidylprolyl isomerase [Fodinicola acaciae]|uniref:peptidylprolyl isomerase n=1 Tax=Fodinicola acaciae TaxID=2681555 RepID=UPI0013D5EE59|nr:peptidylprolyl isomerase [Fodinicola acaciae]